jgi:uncharacterized protein (TIRG00374 family)
MGKSRRIWLVVLLAVAVYLLMAIYADFGELVSTVREFNLALLPALLALVTVSYFIRFLKWDLLLKCVDVNLPFKDSILVFFSGLSMTITPGKLGEIWKGWLIKGLNGEQLSKTIPVVVMERITDVLGLTILSLFGVLYYVQGIYFTIALLAILAAFFVAVRSKSISTRIISILDKRMGKYSDNVKIMHSSFEVMLEPKVMLGMAILGAFAWFPECLGMYLVILGFNESMSILPVTSVYSFASLAGAVSMIPGGLGVAEASISGLLQVLGLTAVKSIGVAIVVRLGTLWYGTITGLCVYVFFARKYFRNRELRASE